MGIKAVTFDLWQTLIIDSPALGRPRAQKRFEGVRAALLEGGHVVNQDQLQEAFRRCNEFCDQIRLAEGDVTFEEQIDIFLKELGDDLHIRITPAVKQALADRYAGCYLEAPPAIDNAAHHVVRAMKDAGLAVGLICNTGSTPGITQRLFLGASGLAQHFDTLTFSDEERLSKPATRLFQLTLDRLGASPEEAVHIGDHPVNDVVGAKRAGLKAVWLRRDPRRVPPIEPDAVVDQLGDVVEALAGLDPDLATRFSLLRL